MMTLPRFLRIVGVSLFILSWFACGLVGQTETATVSGLVTDSTAAAVSGAEVRLQSVERGTMTTTATNDAGIYVFPSVRPGQYQISVQKQGFRQIDLLGLIVNVQDHIEQNFRLQLGSMAESVTVSANDLKINTTDATVSTIVDRQFAENLPMNGRSFQTLIQLTPGVVVTPSTAYDSGQFSINGQRANSNYWMVDGVSANIGIGVNAVGNFGGGPGGSLGSFSALGGTNSLVSVDALQEFRIQTSTYAPEFGRTPGGQISIVTRSGTNQIHGTAFDYLRNDLFDANDWFGNSAVPRLPKPEERQNDFGGTLSGPILKDKTFFFFSYEGLRLRLPQVALTFVPDRNARQSATTALQPFLNAFPLPTPNTPDDIANGIAHFNASFSNKASLDAYSIRIDHRLSDKLALFGRYNYSPSEIIQRGGGGGGGGSSLNDLFSSRITTQTATVGGTWLISPAMTNDVRFNYSRTNADTSGSLDNFGGATPFSSLPFPSQFNSQNAQLFLAVFSILPGGILQVGQSERNLQRQINVVDSLSMQRGSHALKFGVDFRRLSPQYKPNQYSQTVFFFDVPSFENGNMYGSFVASNLNVTFLFRDLGIYAQDTWRISRRLTLTYGVRWDTEFVPQSINGPAFSAATGFDLNDLSKLALARAGTPLFETKYGNFAPRLGTAYQLRQSQDSQTVIRGGFGLFYDLATSEMGNLVNNAAYPFGSTTFVPGPGAGGTATFPLSPANAAPPPIAPPSASNGGILRAFDPHLQLPYTLEWNFAVEQALGKEQRLSASYIGAAGRRLLKTLDVLSPNGNLAHAQLVTNAATSDYNGAQVQFERRLSHGLQALASYTWSHSIDTGSAGSVASTTLVPGSNSNQDRGSSDFDIRSAFSAGLTYELPAPKVNAFAKAILRGWSLQNIIQVRSAPPVNVYNSRFSELNNAFTLVRPDLVPGIPLYLYGSQYPGGEIFNNTPNQGGSGCKGPFCPPPANGNVPARQGNLGRNVLRGFGATQWDFAVHRDFPIHESLRLQFRTEMFNVLNHPNFGQPDGNLNDATFGFSRNMLGRSLGESNLGSGGFDALYQIGGPRSIQFALKLSF